MRAITIVSVCAAVLAGLTACDGPPDAVTKDVAGPGSAAPAEPPDAPAPDASAETAAPQAGQTGPSGPRLEAHEHGRATLAAAVDADRITFSFEAPLASLIGFEHAPETDEQQAALNDLEEAFVLPGNMVSINSEARCLPLMTSSGTHRSEGLAALEVEHTYTCEAPGRVERIEFLMMDDYPALETIEAVFLSDTSQSAGEMSQDDPVLRVR